MACVLTTCRGFFCRKQLEYRRFVDAADDAHSDDTSGDVELVSTRVRCRELHCVLEYCNTRLRTRLHVRVHVYVLVYLSTY